MNQNPGSLLPAAAALLLAATSLTAAVPEADVDFSTPRTPAGKRYRFETEYLTYALDGSRTADEKVIMECAVTLAPDGRQTLECHRFDLVDGAGGVQPIAQLVGWRNTLDIDAPEVLGVTHGDFVNLKGGDGAPLRPDLLHRIYNTFVDFYTFNNVFAQPAPQNPGADIAALLSMGQVIQHYSAFSEPPADLGDAVKKGSYFRNGRVTLEWLGLGRVAQQSCAIVRFDSGESSFQMLLEPAPNTPMRVKGGSHYWGDLFVNRDDYWLERATFKEVVITEVVFGDNPPAAAFVKRLGTIALLP